MRPAALSTGLLWALPGSLFAQAVNIGIIMVPPRIANAANMAAPLSTSGNGDYLLKSGVDPLRSVNSNLPKWIQFSALDRVRFEGYRGSGYRRGSDDAYFLNRFRLAMTIQAGNWLKVHSEAQDARVFGQKPPVGPPNRNAWDLRQAYFELGNGDSSRFQLKVGRQEVNLGAGRQVGNADWTNAGRTYDAALASLRAGRFRVTAFSMSRVSPLAAGVSHHQDGNVLHGLYGGVDTLIPNSVVEPYVFWKLAPGYRTEAGARAKIDARAFGARWTGVARPAFEYALELAGQTGNVGADSIGAALASLIGAYTFRQAWGQPRFFAEYFFVSGDKNPSDGRRGTWEQLHPTIHDRNGLADQIGFQNLQEFRLGVRFSVARNWLVGTEYNDWYLASATDALYAAGASVVARDPTGRSGRHVGRELDFQTSYRLSREVELGAGIGHIFPGRFLRMTTPGSSYTYPYLMFTYYFR